MNKLASLPDRMMLVKCKGLGTPSRPTQQTPRELLARVLI
jgi:hypothetical protein